MFYPKGKQISVKTLTGKTVYVDVEATDTIARVKAKVMAAEGILSPEMQLAVEIMSRRARIESELPPVRFVDVRTGLELQNDEMLQEKLVAGAQLKIVVRKRNDELSPQEANFVHVLFEESTAIVVAAAGKRRTRLTNELAHAVLRHPPVITKTLHLPNDQFVYDVQIAWGQPLIDEAHACLNARGLAFEARDRA